MPINNTRNNLISLLIISTLVIILVALSGSISHATANGAYWLKINKQRNVITAYRNVNGKWKPVRAMLCTTGSVENPTPSGTFKGGYKARWLHMIDEHKVSTYEQYTMLLNRAKQIYIHSVWYYHPSHSAQATAEFNKLGKRGSHGCVRTSTMDAKWIYDNCKVGTKVTIYSSKKSGPLGKPKAIHSSSGWDPTDPAKGNPSFHMRKPVITIRKSKPKTAAYGKAYNLKAKVIAKNPNALMNISNLIKVKASYKWNNSKKKWAKAKFSTKQLGTYKIKYSVRDPYSRSASKYFKIKVTDTVKPTIIGAADKNIEANTISAVNGVTATQPSAVRTGAIKVTVTTPAGVNSTMTYADAAKYVFNQPGIYTVKYTVANKYPPYRTAVKTVSYTVIS